MSLAKTVVFVLLMAMCSSGYVPYDGPSSYTKINGYHGAPIYENVHDDGYDYIKGPEYVDGKDYDGYGYPQYKFSYGVHDPHTGDHKSQHEERDGDVVKGYYTVADPDGTLRTVHYTADDHNGFNAIVQKDGHAIHPEPVLQKLYVDPVVIAPVYDKVIYDKPIYEKPLYDYGNGYGDGHLGHAYGHGEDLGYY